MESKGRCAVGYTVSFITLLCFLYTHRLTDFTTAGKYCQNCQRNLIWETKREEKIKLQKYLGTKQTFYWSCLETLNFGGFIWEGANKSPVILQWHLQWIIRIMKNGLVMLGKQFCAVTGHVYNLKQCSIVAVVSIA